ncbi:MAG: hypothetical protein Q4F39_06900 [Bacteroidia bacterium]|nr:hypothetical protein [Bacteroidia bacterium]
MKKLLLLLASAFPFFSCSAGDGREVKHFMYSEINTMVMGSGETYEVEFSDSSDKVSVTITRDAGRKVLSMRCEPDIMPKIDSLVNEYKLCRLHGSYRPMVDIRDGSQWSFELTLKDGTTTSASGYQTWPNGSARAFSQIQKYLDEIAERHEGERTVSTYDLDGNKLTEIEYDSEGRVCGGYKASDPLATF